MKVELEWGVHGARRCRDDADVLVVVDVLSFSTCVDVACARGARVFPFPMRDREAAKREAARLEAKLAGRRGDPAAEFTLSAPTLTGIPPGTRLVLPSPNGSRISFAARRGTGAVLVGCLRNAAAVARAAAGIAGPDGTVAVVPAGERWRDGGLRPAVEDLIRAGAVVGALGGTNSVEAAIAQSAFLSARPRLREALEGSASGRELIGMVLPDDVEIAARLDASRCVPVLDEDGAFAAATAR